MDAGIRDQDVVDDERLLRILTGDHLDGPRVGADGHDLLSHEPVRGVLANPRLATVVRCVLGRELLEEVAPTRVQDQDVALAQRDVVHLEAGLDVRPGDHRPLVEALPLARAVALELPGRLEHLDHVDEDAAGRERLDVLEAELGHVVLVDELAHRDLVEVAVLAPDVPEPVEVGADVTLTEPRVFHVRELVLAERGTRGEGGRRQDALREARPEEWDAVRQGIRHRNDLPLLDLGRGRLRDRRRDAVGRAGLIVGPPGRGRDDLATVALGERHGG